MEEIRETEDTQSQPATAAVQENGQVTAQERAKMWGLVAAAILVIALLVAAAVFLFAQDAATTSQIRDVFIIFMALEALVIGIALIILVVQLAILINLLQNEVKPILNATNDTANTLKGTATFLSNNLVEPVIKLNEYLAAFKRLGDLIRPGRR